MKQMIVEMIQSNWSWPGEEGAVPGPMRRKLLVAAAGVILCGSGLRLPYFVSTTTAFHQEMMLFVSKVSLICQYEGFRL